MKATELRIGNLTNNNGHISAVTGQDIYDFSQGMDSECYKPIPLTEEWLLKFGFNTSDSDYFEIEIEDSRYYSSCYYYLLEEKSFVYWVCDGQYKDAIGIEIKNNLKYVHQLQNLFFALTGQELKTI